MNLKHYILDADHHLVEVDLLQWCRWFEETERRRVAHTELDSEYTRISTVFIGIDHRFHGDGPPLVYETMIFGDPLDGNMWRYSSWDDAEAGHAAAVRKAREAIGQAKPLVP